MKGYLLGIVAVVLFCTQAQAQGGAFSIRVREIYPGNATVYGNTFSLSNEQDAAERKLVQQYSGRDANYVIELTRPWGEETRPVQNIKWILIENGIRTLYRSEPVLPDCSPEVLRMELYPCNNNGSRIGGENVVVRNLDHYYKFYIGSVEQMRSNFTSRDRCLDLAKKYYDENKREGVSCRVVVYNSDNVEIDSIDNGEALREWQNALKNASQPTEIEQVSKILKPEIIRRNHSAPVK